MSIYPYCMFMYLHRASWHSSATLTEICPCFFLTCKANARVKPAKTGHGPHSSKIFVLFCVLFVCKCALLGPAQSLGPGPEGQNSIPGRAIARHYRAQTDAGANPTCRTLTNTCQRINSWSVNFSIRSTERQLANSSFHIPYTPSGHDVMTRGLTELSQGLQTPARRARIPAPSRLYEVTSY